MPAIPQDVIAAAQASQKKWGVPASISLSQWWLESGFGAHVPPGSNNPFGIKARPGEPFVTSYTREVLHNGRSVVIEQHFRKFASLAEAFDYHGELIATHAAYAHVMAMAGKPLAFARALTGIYATDPHYGDELVALIGGHDLQQYDAKPSVAPPAKTV